MKFFRTHIASSRVWRHAKRLLSVGFVLSAARSLRAENHAEYRYEDYTEDNERMEILTHSIQFEQKLLSSLTAKGELIYDGISGATPTGTYRVSPTSGLIRTVTLHDIRRAGHFEADLTLGNHTITPGYAYSKESDYESSGISLSDSMEFNQKNTVLQIGASHNFDRVQRNGTPFPEPFNKDATEVLIGVSQLLSPKTILNVNLTFGYESGYLSDPYRQAEFVYPLHLLGVVRFENRPAERYKGVLLTSVTQYIDPLEASIEGSYRFYYDTYEIPAHTVSVIWHQHLGKHFLLEPAFRFYAQEAAEFYSPLFMVDPATIQHYSADYRLSNFYSLDYGIQASWLINDHVRITAGYHRYEMNGLDDTVAAMYPQADIYTIGASILW